MKGKSIIEVIIVFLLMKFFSIWLDAWLKEAGVVHGWRDLCFGLQAIVIPLGIIWLSKRSWATYGLGRASLRYLIHYGFVGAMIMMLGGLGFGFLRSRQISSTGMEGSLIMTVVALIMIGILFFVFRRSNSKSADVYRGSRLTYELIILIGMVLCPIVVAAVRQCFTIQIVGWDLYYLVMVGFGEEIKYRGYFQSRINEQYGRPWEISGISFGPGLIIVSILFGLSHMGQFGSFNPFEGLFEINRWVGLQAFCGSLFYGLIREKSGSVVPCGIAHGVPSAFGQTLARVL